MFTPATEMGLDLPRGVYQAPWIGPDGEVVLIAITRQHKLAAGPVTVPHGASRVGAADELWAVLDRVDPMLLKLI